MLESAQHFSDPPVGWVGRGHPFQFCTSLMPLASRFLALEVNTLPRYYYKSVPGIRGVCICIILWILINKAMLARKTIQT